MIRNINKLGLLLIFAGISSAGCSSSDSKQVTGNAEGPLYALGIRVANTDDTSVGYIVTVPSIEAGSKWSLDQAVEVGADAWLAGSEGQREVLISSSSEPSIARWKVEEDGSVTRGDVLSFAGLGLQRSRESRGTTALYLKDKAYFMSSDGQIVVWNPSTMEIIGTVPWDFPTGYSPEGLFSGDEERVLMTVNLYPDETNDWTVYEDDVHLVEIDPKTDTVVNETVEPRCTNLSVLSFAPDGTSYHSPYAPLTSLTGILGAGHGPKSCSLRIVPPATEYDAGYDVNLSDLVEGRPAGGVFVRDSKTAFVRVWHEELAPRLAADKSNFEELMFAAAYQWWRWPLGSDHAELVAGQEATTGQWEPTLVDGRTLIPKVSADYDSTQLLELEADGTMQPLIEGPGTLLGIVRVR